MIRSWMHTVSFHICYSSSENMAATFKTLVRKLHSSAPFFNLAHPPNPENYKGAIKMWRNLTFFVAFPAIGLCMVNAYLDEKEHMAHFERPEFIPYEHLNRRNKKFPWGDGNHSLFFNKAINTTPEGYDE